MNTISGPVVVEAVTILTSLYIHHSIATEAELAGYAGGVRIGPHVALLWTGLGFEGSIDIEVSALASFARYRSGVPTVALD